MIRDFLISSPIALARGGGTAFPTWKGFINSYGGTAFQTWKGFINSSGGTAFPTWKGLINSSGELHFLAGRD